MSEETKRETVIAFAFIRVAKGIAIEPLVFDTAQATVASLLRPAALELSLAVEVVAIIPAPKGFVRVSKDGAVVGYEREAWE
jgi:hypothetical protein